MRNSRRLTWLIFTVCALLVVDGLGWVTWQMLSLERREQEAQHRAERQEAVRLALWRMDGLLSPLIAAEAARPYFHYRSFYPAERAYSRMWEPIGPEEPLAASPLLANPGEHIRLHFEGAPGGWITSPQVPPEELRARVRGAGPADFQSAERSLLDLTAILRGAPQPTGGVSDRDVQLPLRGARADDRLAEQNEQLQKLAQRERDEPGFGLGLDSLAEPELQDEDAGRSVSEYQARKQAAEFARNTQTLSERQFQAPAAVEGQTAGDAAPASLGAESAAPPESVHTGPLTPVWRRDPGSGEPELLFVRAVRVNQTETLQGVWMDWPALREALLATSRDLLPEAALQPLVTETGARPASLTSLADAGRLLAGVPAVLVSGSVEARAIRGLTATRTVLVIAWLAVAAAIAAIGLVLRASLLLSERRGRFVSAVTHELRTPLTTFCLYSQMLADGMVRDDQRRAEYLGTLRRESDRLATIVENVLAYARMGASGPRADAPAIAVTDLLATLVPSLRERAEQAGMLLEVDADSIGELHLAADRGSVERVIANLVDNACKYAAEAADKRITLSVRPSGRGVEFGLRDRGPGVSKRERRRIFSPFVRARRVTADGSSGLGLGLALARGVARSLGGDLRLVRPDRGAEFVLWLPCGDGAVAG